MILYLDTETTGLYPGNICQLSYVMQTEKEIKAKNFFFTVDYVEAGAYYVHGFSVKMLKELSGGKRFSDNINEIEQDFLSADLIISHNVNFDFMFLREEFISCGKTFTFKESFCSMKNTTAVCKLPRKSGVGYKYPKLNELCEYFGICEESIKEKVEELFGSNSSFHDARFDTTAVFLSINKGIDKSLFNLYDYI